VLDGDIIKVNMKTPNTEEVLGSTPDSWSSAREELDLEVKIPTFSCYGNT